MSKIRYVQAIPLILFLCFAPQLSAQWLTPNSDYLVSYPSDVSYFFTQPVDWESRQWVAAGGIVITGGIILLADEPIRDFFQRNRSAGSDAISANFAEPWGSGWYSGPLVVGMYLWGGLSSNNQHQKAALDGAKAFLIAGAGSAVIKNLFHRERPNEQDIPNNLAFHGPFTPIGEHTSFVSGHTASAFALATVISRSYDDPWVGIVAYSVAGMTGLSRVNDDVHWASDVYFGALLGYLVGTAVMNNDSRWNLMALPNGLSFRLSL